MRRVSVVGNSGSGKTTLARRLAATLGAPHLELDSVYHQPGWTALPLEEFRHRVAEFTSAVGWVVDGNYSAVQDIVWKRADTVIFLDLPKSVVIRQLVWRTTRRSLVRRELWNGNRESIRNALSRDPEVSVIRWAWQNHARNHERYSVAMTDPAWSHLRFVQLRSRHEAREWLDAVAATPAHPTPAARGGSVEG